MKDNKKDSEGFQANSNELIWTEMSYDEQRQKNSKAKKRYEDKMTKRQKEIKIYWYIELET